MTGAPTAAAPPRATASAGRNCAMVPTNPIIAAAPNPAAARCSGPMRLPVAANARSSRLTSAAGNAFPCGRGRRNDTTSLSAPDTVRAIAFKRGPILARRRSARITRKSAQPSSTVEPKAARSTWMNNSHPPNANGIEELSIESEARSAGNEIGAHPGGFEGALDMAVVPLAVVLESEELSRGDDVAFHTRDFDDALHSADPIPHALDVYDEVEGARDMHTDRLERKVEVRHHHHVFDAVERVARRVGMDRGH